MTRTHRSLRLHRQFRHAALGTLAAAGILLGAAAVPLGVAASASAATTTPVAPSDILARAVAQGKQQGAARDYTPLVAKPRWKVLFVGFTDVGYSDGSARQKMDANDRTYMQNVANQFVSVLDQKMGVQIVPAVKWYDTPFTTSNPTKRIDLPDSASIIKNLAAVGEYDSIIVASKGNNGGGTQLSWQDSRSQEASYTYFSLAPSNGRADYPATTAYTDRSTTLALHEFSHALSCSGVGFPYPDLHNAAGYGYKSDPNTEWTPFYLDYLTGKVKVNGVPQGTYPKMWSVSPRFSHHPAMATVHHQNEAGRTIAPDVSVFGVGGDPYSIAAPMINGYRSVSVKSGSAPAAAQFSTGNNADITLVYSGIPTKLTFIGGEGWDLNQVQTAGPGAIAFGGFTYRAAVPITGYTYTDQILGADGVRRTETLLGMPIAPWPTNGIKRVYKDGNAYTVTRKSDTLVEISVELGTPSTTFSVNNLGYGNLAPTARVAQMFDVLDVTPQLTGVKESLSTEPHAYVTATWGDYKVKAGFVGGETQDFNRVQTRNPSEKFSDYYVYRTPVPISGYTYTDRIVTADGVKRVDSFNGQPISFTAAGSSSFTWEGHSVTIMKKSDTMAEISVTLTAPSTTFPVRGLDTINSAPTGRANSSLEIMSVTSGFYKKTDAQTAPKGNSTTSWGNYTTKVTFVGGQTVDLTTKSTLKPNVAHVGNYVYRAAAPITKFTYADQIDSQQNAGRLDRLGGVPLNWNAAGVATVTKDGNTYTAVRKSNTRVEVSVTLGTPSTTFTAWDTAYVNTAPFGTLKQTTDLLDITPQQTGVKEAQTTEPKGHLDFVWGAGGVG